MRRFDGRVAFVTGAAHGIGRATALRLRSEGASVVLADIDEENLERAVEMVERAGGGGDSGAAEVLTVRCDVTERHSVESAVAAAVGRFGGLDVLVNTSGGSGGAKFEEFDDAGWRWMAELNLQGAMRCIDTA
jgi:meso-butanediol dehydrogenase / (S,S)-butanediol dehydrogenase / diacetyl reductase